LRASALPRLALALVALTPTLARAASPQCPKDTGNAREMEQKGRELFEEALRREASDPRSALEILSCVQRFADKPAVSLRIGIIAERLGNKKLAVSSFERYLALAGSAAPDRVEMMQHIEQLRMELGIAPPPSTKPDEPAPPPPPPEQPKERGRDATPGWIITGAGVALIAVGGVLLVSAKNRNDDVHALEPGTTYWNSSEARDQIDAAKREQLFGIIGVAAGAVTAAVGAWWLVDAKSGTAVGARVAPGSARLDVHLAF